MRRILRTIPSRNRAVPGTTTALFTALALISLVSCASLEGARLYRSGTHALERGDVAVAVQDLERASALVPEASEIHNHLGLAYTAAGREADAVQAFERAVALDCDNHAARRNLETVAAGTHP